MFQKRKFLFAAALLALMCMSAADATDGRHVITAKIKKSKTFGRVILFLPRLSEF